MRVFTQRLLGMEFRQNKRRRHGFARLTTAGGASRSLAGRKPMTIDAWFETLRGYGLSLPEATEDHPWGHSALKVRGKTFCWLDKTKDGFSATTKLPASRDFAMVFDFTEPTGYGLGRAGWVTSRFAADAAPDLYLLRRWIAESYRAVAPKKLAATVSDPD
jgi:predicted DNA-binding protein (MmcQ/YjbR family)